MIHGEKIVRENEIIISKTYTEKKIYRWVASRQDSFLSSEHGVLSISNFFFWTGGSTVWTLLLWEFLESTSIYSRICSTFLCSEHLLSIYEHLIVYYVARRIVRVITRWATMHAGDQSRGAISPASIVASLLISRIVCIGTYSILCDFGAFTSFYAYTRI